MVAELFPASSVPPIRSVSLARLSAELSRAAAGIGRIAVEGEVSRPRTVASGWCYFTLRDRAAQLIVSCPPRARARCRVVDGERAQVTGALSWRSGRGAIELVAEEVVPVGAGAIAAALEATRRRLVADGLVDRPRRPLPVLPRVVGVVCGTDAAVRADIESVVAERFPGYPVWFAETTVQGPGAAAAILEALRSLLARPEVEVVILARGGGDATALLPFSDETLCRAVAASSVPVVSAVGHHEDRPLCDEVAERRFGTPSLAAAAVIPSRLELERELDDRLARLADALAARRQEAEVVLRALDPSAVVDDLLVGAARRLERVTQRLALAHPGARAREAGARLAGARDVLAALDPVAVLSRGYAVVRRADGLVVRRPAEAPPGTRLELQVAAGRLGALAGDPIR